MRAADILTSAMESRGKNQRDIAAVLHSKTSTFSKHIRLNALRAQELVDAAEYLGYKVVLVDMETDAEMPVVSKGAGPRVRKQIGGVTYDTAKANAICHTERKDGWWLELYQHTGGDYFVAHYTDWEGVENFITPCPADEARKLMDENVW